MSEHCGYNTHNANESQSIFPKCLNIRNANDNGNREIVTSTMVDE